MNITIYKEQTKKTLDYLITELKSIQVGNASTTMLDNINVETNYGAIKLPQLGHITVMDSKTIKVEARDKKELGNIEKGIYASDLGLTPRNKGGYIIVKIPEITQERRQEIVKKIKSMAEESKAQIRVIRQDAIKTSKKLLEDKEISEDQHKNNEIDINKLIKEKTSNIDTIIKEKTDQIIKL